MTQPTGLLHPDWTVSPWKECKEHWDRIRAGLKPPVWPPQPVTLFMELTDDPEKDLRRYHELRAQAFKARAESKADPTSE